MPLYYSVKYYSLNAKTTTKCCFGCLAAGDDLSCCHHFRLWNLTCWDWKKNGYRKTRDRVRVKNDNNKLYSHRENITRKTERYFVVYIIIYYYMSVRRQIGWLRIWVDVRVTRHRINNNMTSPTWKWMYKTVYEVVGTGWEGERT